MRVLFLASVFSLVLAAVAADAESSCLDALQNCYDYNIFAIERKLKIADLTSLTDVCMLYSTALKCMDTLPCRHTSMYNKKKDFLENELYKDVAGACETDGSMSNCFFKLVQCEGNFQQADKDLQNHNSGAGCLEVATFDKCVKEAQQICPDRAVADVYEDWEPLNKDAAREGCDVDCNEALKECTYDLQASDANDKEEYCEASRRVQKCLKNTMDNIGCSDANSQKYLETAIKQKASKYKDQCGGVARSAQASLLVILATIAASLVSRRMSQ